MEKKRIYKYEFNEILKKISDISVEERGFLNKVFANDLIDGLTEFELKEKIARLKVDTKDQIDRWEAEKIKNKLLEAMK